MAKISAWRLLTASLLALAFASASFSSAAAVDLTPDQIETLKQMPKDQRDALLKEYGIDPATIDGPSVETGRDTSQPEVMKPRLLESSEPESAAAERSSTDIAGASGTDMPLKPLGADEVNRAFRNFRAESKPLDVDTHIDQFGYDLFAGVPSTFAPATDIPVTPDYLIGPGDELHVQLFGKTNLAFDLVVDRDGQVAFPDLGPISVTGLTFEELKDRLGAEVEERMIGVRVNVSMGRLRSIRVFVLGEVFQSGSFSVSGLSTLTNALFVSGGIKKTGSLRHVQLKRSGKLVQEMDLYDLLLRGDTSSDARLMPGDAIFVPVVGPLVGVAGDVMRPAIYEMTGKMTASDLLELAGGIKSSAYQNLLQLERIVDGKKITTDFPLGSAGELELQDSDLLKVFPILDREDGVVYLEGNVLRPGKREFVSGMRIKDLVSSAKELLPETHFDYGLIERENEINREIEYVTFNLGKILFEDLESENFLLKPRDRLFVFNAAHFRESKQVVIRGKVKSEGRYSFQKEMRALDLILAAGGLLREAWLPEAELFRTDPVTLDVTKIALNLEGVLADVHDENILLMDRDYLMVHSIWEFKEPERVEIMGEVNYPGTYPLFEGMRVSDLIFAGGYLRGESYRKRCELTRYQIIGGERRVLNHVILDLESILAGNAEANLPLQPYDRLLISRISNWRADEVVTVSGEVTFPGSYPIEEGERLSNLIGRFGGFLSNAYLPAAIFTRENVKILEQHQLARMADQLESDLTRQTMVVDQGRNSEEAMKRQVALEAGRQLVRDLRQASATGRLVIELKTAMALQGTDLDLVLKDKDRLHIPKKPDFVVVLGQVHNPTAFQFISGKKGKHYIELAGGKTRFADGKRIHVVRADGSVRKDGQDVTLLPGDVVIIPETLERFSMMEFMLDLSQVVYQLGLAAASAKTIGVLN